MKIIKISKLIPLSISIAAIALASASWAAGTAADTNINNTATLSYSVGSGAGTAQTVIESSEAGNSNPGAGNGTATTFKVDKKIDLLVTTGSGVDVVPGTSAQAITYTLKNEGNSQETFSFATNPITVTSTTAPFKFAITTCNTPADVTLAADASQVITVSCTIPVSSTSVTNTSTSLVDLKATAVGVSETAGADTAGTMDTVFADNTGTSTDGADRNASHSAVNTYTVHTADLTVRKESAVTKMSVNGSDITAANGAKRIPGSTIEYTITVVNASGAATATGIVINDAVPKELTVVGTPTVTGGTSTNASSGSYSSTTGTAVATTAFNLAAGETAVLTIIATVN